MEKERNKKDTELLDKAIKFAADKHQGQLRKLSFTPYILHPLEVAGIIATLTNDLEVMAAGVLHDTLEDTQTTPEELVEHFGKRVSALVQSESEDKMDNRPAEDTWYERKADSLLWLANNASIEVKMLWLGDKLSNMRSFYREYLKIGNKIFEGLHQTDPKMHAWYYRTIAENLKEFKDTAAYQEYVQLVEKVFGKE